MVRRKRYSNPIHSIDELPTSMSRSQWDVTSTYRRGKKVRELPEDINIYSNMRAAVTEARKRQKRYGGKVTMQRYRYTGLAAVGKILYDKKRRR